RLPAPRGAPLYGAPQLAYGAPRLAPVEQGADEQEQERGRHDFGDRCFSAAPVRPRRGEIGGCDDRRDEMPVVRPDDVDAIRIRRRADVFECELEGDRRELPRIGKLIRAGGYAE